MIFFLFLVTWKGVGGGEKSSGFKRVHVSMPAPRPGAVASRGQHVPAETGYPPGRCAPVFLDQKTEIKTTVGRAAGLWFRELRWAGQDAAGQTLQPGSGLLFSTSP